MDFTSYIDLTQVVLYGFWLGFAGLVYYLRREDKREGYPLRSDRRGVVVQGFPAAPGPKRFVTHATPDAAPPASPAAPAGEVRP